MMEADEPLWNAFVTILAEDGHVIGGGIYGHYGDPKHPTLLTCAHVVNLALGRSEFTVDSPGQAEVTLEFPAVPEVRVKARVGRWWPASGLTDPNTPPVRGHDGRWVADVAELEPTMPLPAELQPVPLAVPELGDTLWAWRGNGDPRTVVRLRGNGAAGEWLVLEAPPTGFAVQPGYSGGPLWDRRRAAVVGLMVSAHDRVAYSNMTTAVPFRQSYGIRGDVLLERLLGKHDPRSSLDPRVWPLLKAQQQAAVSFPYRSVGLHRDDLTQVYVRQQLTAGAEPQDRSHSAQEAAQAEDERPPRTVEEFLARFRHVLVVGTPGTGKSTLTLQLSAELVRVPGLRQGGATQLIPIRVSARDLASRPEGELSAAISAAARAAVSARLGIDIGEDLCVRPAGTLPWLLIIDGLDEIENATARADLSGRLRRFMDLKTKHRLLITTRQLPSRENARWQARRDLGRCEIEPFERGQRRDFVERWFRNRPALAGDFLNQISTARLEEVVSVPLLATVAAIVFEERSGQPLPQTAFSLYQRFVSHLYESRTEQLTTNLRARLAGWAESDRIMERLVTGRIDLLEHCAAAWLRGTEILPTALEWLRTANSQPYPQPTDWPDVVAAVLTSTGLVTHDGTNLTFLHRSFAEHLAAAGAARRLPARFDADDPRWWHTLRSALTSGRPQDHEVVLHRALLSDTGDLLDWLLAGDDEARELAARLIFEGVPSAPAHHGALTETLSYWVSRVPGSSPWRNQLVRVIDTVRIAPAPVVDLLVEMLDGSRHPLALRDAAIRALLRAGSAASEAVRALVAIMDERPLTGSQRVRAAEMLMDLGAEARAAARAGLLRISGERDWVLSNDRERAAKLVEEIDASAPSQEVEGALATRDDADLSGSEAWACSTSLPGNRSAVRPGSEAWAYSTLVRGNRPTAQPGALAAWNNIVQTDEPVGRRQGTTEALGPRSGAALKGSVSVAPARSNSRSVGHLLYPKVRAALGLPPTGTLDSATTGAVVYGAIRAAILAPGPPEADRDLLLHQGDSLRPRLSIARGGRPVGPDLSEEQWDNVARWLCAHPEAHVPATAEASFDVGGVIASTTPARVHALAASLIHGPQSTARRAYELLARRALSETAEAPLQLLRIATESARRPIDQFAAEPVLAAICIKLRHSEYPHNSAYVQTARTMGSGLFAVRLVSGRSSDPRGNVRALLSLGDEHMPDAIRFLAAQVHGPLGGFSEWCTAVRLLRRLPQATSPVIRLVREVIEKAHDPEQILELCRVLIDYSAVDTATEYLLELSQDASARTVERRKAVELLPRGEGHEDCARRAHVVMTELTAGASPAERVALADTLRSIDPQGCRSATALILSALDDATLPSRARLQALALLAAMGPGVRRQLVADLEKLHGRPTDSDTDRLTILRSVSQWGPDLHRAAQGIWEHLTQRRTGIERVAMAAELHKWGWTSESRSARLLTRVARSATEEPQVRVAAAHALLRHGAGMSRTSGEVLHQLVREGRVSPILALQTARDLAAAGGLLEARRVLSELILNATVPDSHRYKAATVLLMVDLTCGPDTLAALRHMTSDRTLSEQTRNWATYAVDCARGGIRAPDGPPPGSWLRS